jgi:hypothetical protein
MPLVNPRWEEIGATKAVTATGVAVTKHALRNTLLVQGFGFKVTTAVVIGTTNGVIKLQKLAKDGSTATDKATWTQNATEVAKGATVGNTIYVDLCALGTQFEIEPGEAVQVNHTTAAATGSPAGSLISFIRGVEVPIAVGQMSTTQSVGVVT